MLIAYLPFSFIDVGAKWLGLLGLSALQLAFMRYIGHFVISTAIIIKGGTSLDRFGSDQIGLVVVRGLLLAVATVFNFVAVRYLSLTLTSTILFSAPIMICALSWQFLGERVGIWRWSAIIVGFFGILVAIRPFDESFHWAAFLSLAGAFCFALYILLTRKLSGIVATEVLQFYSGFTGAILLLPFAIAFWQNPETLFQWIVMVMMGFFGWLGHQCLTLAHGFAPASTLTPYGYVFIIYLTIWSMLVFDQFPDQWTIIGALIVVISGLVIWFREMQFSKQMD